LLIELEKKQENRRQKGKMGEIIEKAEGRRKDKFSRCGLVVLILVMLIEF